LRRLPPWELEQIEVEPALFVPHQPIHGLASLFGGGSIGLGLIRLALTLEQLGQIAFVAEEQAVEAHRQHLVLADLPPLGPDHRQGADVRVPAVLSDRGVGLQVIGAPLKAVVVAGLFFRRLAGGLVQISRQPGLLIPAG
jgi:hypothetical protein